MDRRRFFSPLLPSRWEYVGYAEINKGFKRIMNFRVLAASAQAPQRSNGNDFLPHNAPRAEKGGLEREGAAFKGRWGCRWSARGLLCFKAAPIFTHAFHNWVFRIFSINAHKCMLMRGSGGWGYQYIPVIFPWEYADCLLYHTLIYIVPTSLMCNVSDHNIVLYFTI